MTPLQLALKKKFGTPEKALEALGLSPTLLAGDEIIRDKNGQFASGGGSGGGEKTGGSGSGGGKRAGGGPTGKAGEAYKAAQPGGGGQGAMGDFDEEHIVAAYKHAARQEDAHAMKVLKTELVDRGATVPSGLGAAMDSGRNRTMNKLSKIALLARSAMTAHFAPLLAADAQLDLTAAVEGVTRKNFDEKKAAIWAASKAIAKPLMAKDEAGPDDVAMRILDLVAGQAAPEPAAAAPAEPGVAEADQTTDVDEVGGGMTTEPNGAAQPGAGGGEPDPEKLKALTAKLGGDAELARACYDIMHGGGEGAEPEPKPEPAAAAEPKEEPGVDKKAKDGEPVMKPAMDAAIAGATAAVREQMRKEAREAQEARAFVRPWVGELSLAFDTADAIFEAALKARGVSTKGVHPTAFKTILGHLPKPNGRQELARDSSLSDRKGKGFGSAADFFPGAADIQIL